MKSSIRLKKRFRDLNMSGIDGAAYTAATKGLWLAKGSTQTLRKIDPIQQTELTWDQDKLFRTLRKKRDYGNEVVIHFLRWMLKKILA